MNLENVLKETIKEAVSTSLANSTMQLYQLLEQEVENSLFRPKYSPDSLLTEQQVSELLQIDICTLQHWRLYKKFLPYHKMGRNVRYKYSDILEFNLKTKINVSIKYKNQE